MSKTQMSRMQAFANKRAGMHMWVGQGTPSYDKNGLAQEIMGHFNLSHSDVDMVMVVVKEATFKHAYKLYSKGLR